MTDTLKAGDTVWTVEGEWIQNFDDDHYAIKIPTHVCSHIVKEYKEHSECTPTRYRVRTTDNRYYENCEYRKEYYLIEDEALKELRKQRKQFLKCYPNNWQKIVEELQQLLKEQDR
jgi:hypothetical protein